MMGARKDTSDNSCFLIPQKQIWYGFNGDQMFSAAKFDFLTYGSYLLSEMCCVSAPNRRNGIDPFSNLTDELL